MAHGPVEKAPRIPGTVLRQLIGAAMKLISPRFQNHVCNRAGSPAQFAIVIRRRNAHLLQCFRWRNQNL